MTSLMIAVVGLLWFAGAVTTLFAGHFRVTGNGILSDITSTASHLVHAHPQTFLLLFLFFFTTLILSCIGLIVYQNKTKKDQDFICFTLLAEMMRQRPSEESAEVTVGPRAFPRAG